MIAACERRQPRVDPPARDRKGVVEGKSVELGVRQMRKAKKKLN